MNNLREFYLQHIDPRRSDYLNNYKDYLLGKSKILDVGCGIGNFISLDPKHIVGIDQNIESLKIAKKRGFNVQKADASKLPFNNQSIDGIFCSHVIEHLYPEKALNMLYEFDRVLKKGGVIVLKSPLMYSRFYQDLTHIRPYPPESIMDYLMQTTMTSTQRTANLQKKASYIIENLSYRYDYIYYPLLEPSRIQDTFAMNLTQIAKIASMVLYKIGIRNYLVKNGYTLVLKKL